MNALSISDAPAWFNALLNLSLQATLLAAMVWVVLKLVGRWIPPSWRALMWFLVIARVLIPYSPPSFFSVQNLFAKTPARAPVRSVTIGPARFDLESPVWPALRAALIPPDRQESPGPVSIGRAMAAGWILTAGFCIATLVARSLVIRYRIVRHGSPPVDSTLALLAECRAKMRLRYPLRVTASDRIAAPALTGLIPARLIIPKAFAPPSFSIAQIRHILLHELAHVQQGHLLFHWLGLVARAVHWFNPAIHFAASRMRQECELAADAAALKGLTDEQRAAYGETILQTLARSVAPPTLLALGMAEHARHLKQRLRALRNRQRFFTPLGIVCAGLLALTGLTGESRKAAEVVGDYHQPVPGFVPSSNPFAHALTGPAMNRQGIYRKLESIRIDSFATPTEIDLIELLKELGSEVRRRDPRGMNFLLNPALPSSANAVDVDIARFKIKFDPPIRDVTLGQFLDAMVMVAKPPQPAPAFMLRYSVEDYGIVFSLRPNPGEQLVSRTFKINPNLFRQGLDGSALPSKMIQEPAGNQSGISFVSTVTNLSTIQQNARAFFTAAGVDFPTNNVAVGGAVPERFGMGERGQPAQKALFFNDRAGVLYVRATLRELDIIENAIHTINTPGLERGPQ